MILENGRITIAALAIEVVKSSRAVKDSITLHKKEFEFYGALESVADDTLLNREQVLLVLSRMYIYPPAKVKLIKDLFPDSDSNKCATCERIEFFKESIFSLLDSPVKDLFLEPVVTPVPEDYPINASHADIEFERKLESV